MTNQNIYNNNNEISVIWWWRTSNKRENKEKWKVEKNHIKKEEFFEKQNENRNFSINSK